MTTKVEVRNLPPGVADTPTGWPRGQHIIAALPRPAILPSSGQWIPERRQSPLESVQIQNLLDDRLRMLESVSVVLEREGPSFIAKWSEIQEFGYGTDPFGAVDDLRITIAELYWTLKAEAEQDRLGANLAIVWRRLSRVIQTV